MENTKTLQGKLLLVLKGLAMGAANKVPGVSGGVVAFVASVWLPNHRLFVTAECLEYCMLDPTDNLGSGAKL